MKIFIWNYLRHVSNSSHTEGGLVVTADSVGRAYELANHAGVVFEADELYPDEEYALLCDVEESVYKFSDSGLY